jgi:8-oxo-dGTP diphosphatase
VTRPQPAVPPGPAPTHPVDVFLVLFDGDKVLLALREGTGYRDGWWNVPSGKLEYHEDALTGIRREAHEEIGVRFADDEPGFAGVVHHRNPEGQSRIALVFAAEYDMCRHGEPVNREPHKCAEIGFRSTDCPRTRCPTPVPPSTPGTPAAGYGSADGIDRRWRRSSHPALASRP